MKELIKKTEAELVKLLKEKTEALRVFNFALSGSKTRNIKEGSGLKKEVARILTVLNAKKLETK